MAGARNQGATRLERNWAAVERFAAACQGDAAVLAAFLGGSLAAGTADEESDLDVYIVVAEPGYDAFVDRPKDFLASWGEVAFATTLRNFEGLGFEMVLFVMTDGVEGELAVGKEANFRSTHGGPHRVLVDKTGILEGVEFPALALDDRARSLCHAPHGTRYRHR